MAKKRKSRSVMAMPEMDEEYKVRDGVDTALRFEALRNDNRLYAKVTRRLTQAARSLSRRKSGRR